MNTSGNQTQLSQAGEKTRVLIVDGSLLFRQAMRVLLERQQDIEVIAEAGDGKEAVQVAVRLRPDIVLMDIDLPAMDGFQAAGKIAEKSPTTRVLLLSQHSCEEHIARLNEVRVGGYLPKTVPVEVIIHAIRTIAAGEIMRPPQTLGKPNIDVIVEPLTQSSSVSKSNDLTPKEIAILRLVARGLSNKDIAFRLNLSLRYVKASLTTIFMKLHVSSRTEAVSFALKTGILTLDDING